MPLAGKNVSKMTYFALSRTWNFHSVKLYVLQ